MSKWDSEITEEKLQDQIKAAKEAWKKLRFKVEKVYYSPIDKHFYFYISDSEGVGRHYSYSTSLFKCLENLSEKELAEVTLLGNRAIEWERLDIQICLDKLLDGIQMIDDWMKNLSEY